MQILYLGNVRHQDYIKQAVHSGALLPAAEAGTRTSQELGRSRPSFSLRPLNHIVSLYSSQVPYMFGGSLPIHYIIGKYCACAM